MAWHPAGCRELPEEAPHPRGVLRNIGVDLGVGAFEGHVRQDGRAAVTRAGQEDGVEVVLPDQAVEVGIDEAEAGRGTPVPEEARLYVRRIQRLAQKRVVLQVDLADSQVVGGLPVTMYPGELLRGEWAFGRLLGGEGRPRRRGFFFDHTGDGRVETVHALLLSVQFSCSMSLLVCQATIRSSSVGTTRTVTAASSLEMTGACAALRSGSSRMPRNSRPSQTRSRTVAECSPMPPVKTRASSPPRAAAKAPRNFFAW